MHLFWDIKCWAPTMSMHPIMCGASALLLLNGILTRRHDVLVIEARSRIGGRLRTVDLMLDSVNDWEGGCRQARGDDDEKTNKSSVPPSDLFRVKQWSPVDVGGAFIHGTGLSTTTTATTMMSEADGNDRATMTTTTATTRLGSHDFGTSGGCRKSERLGTVCGRKKVCHHRDIGYDSVRKKRKQRGISHRVKDGIGSLNSMYVLARQKLRLPMHAVVGGSSTTCRLVDHNGRIIRDDIDREVSK